MMNSVTIELTLTCSKPPLETVEEDMVFIQSLQQRNLDDVSAILIVNFQRCCSVY